MGNRMTLLSAVRHFWYNNIPDVFSLNGHQVARQQIQIYGGPSRRFDCPICQESEWLSRVEQQNLFEEHACSTALVCKKLCSMQGQELWTLYHQDFTFSVGCDKGLNAPRGLCVFRDVGARLYPRYCTRNCDSWIAVLRRQLAQACMIDIVKSPDGVDFSLYDFVFFQNAADDLRFDRCGVPLVMYIHDQWRTDKYQDIFDRFSPECVLTPYPFTLRRNYKLSSKTEVLFYPLSASMFFTRPNLNSATKSIDLLVAGSLNSYLYGPRKELDAQVRKLPSRFAVEFSHLHGAQRNRLCGPVEGLINVIHPVRFLNKWSEYLGTAKFVVFAGFGDKRYRPMFMKYFECLGSGAIMIAPKVDEMDLLGLKPMVHYIPLSSVWGNNKKLASMLSHYKDYKHIAETAVAWHTANADRLLFDGFEDCIRMVTGERYPRRLVA